jgi:hypothetical protein
LYENTKNVEVVRKPEVKLAVDEFCEKYNQTIDIVTLDGCPSFLIKIKK